MDTASHRKHRTHSLPLGTLVITLPHWRVLRLVARSLLLVLALFSFPWIEGRMRYNAIELKAPIVQSDTKIDVALLVPFILRDLRRRGMFTPGNYRSLFLGSGVQLRPPFLIGEMRIFLTEMSNGSESIPDGSADLVVATDGIRDAETAVFADRVLGIGGVLVTKLSEDLFEVFRLLRNYTPVYVRRFTFASTVVAMRKVAGAPSWQIYGEKVAGCEVGVDGCAVGVGRAVRFQELHYLPCGRRTPE